MPKVASVFGVEPFRIGGTETFARELSRQLGVLGWESIICFQSDAPPEVRSFLELPNVTFEVIGDSSAVDWRTISSLARVLHRYKPEILHLHFTGFLSIFPWLAKLFGIERVFFTDHTSRPEGYVLQEAHSWKKAVVRLINWPLTRVICVSNYGYRCMTALNLLPKNRFELIYNGVDFSRVHQSCEKAKQFRTKYRIPQERKIVLQVSWIIPEKGIPELLTVAQVVLSRNEEVHFVIVGEGVYRQQYMEDAEALGIAKHITWTGLVQDPVTEGVYDAADIVCQLSRWEEVFGWMIAEGMAYAKPIIATRVGGIPELTVDGESGFLVDLGDTNAAADRVLCLVEDTELRHRLGIIARDRARSKFNLTDNVAKLVTAYGIGPIQC